MTCNGCGDELAPLDAFPGGVCLDCHAKTAPMPTADDVVRMWGGDVR